ncbi:MAG: GNAT family N-acetyltransferase [Vitreoscilla sp.]
MIKLRTVDTAELANVELVFGGVLRPVQDSVLLSHVVVAEDESAVIGVATVEMTDTVGFLRLHFLSAVYRGQGVGTRIVRHAVRKGFERGLTTVFVSATRLETFYYRAGFGPDDFSFLPTCFWSRVASDPAHQPSVMSCRRAIGGGDGAGAQAAFRCDLSFPGRRDCDFEA